jgi:bifunctional DNA-binding transcriptional regulator/antitoxin component of YhaV-PrlF toxin-antitoxin module
VSGDRVCLPAETRRVLGVTRGVAIDLVPFG